MAEGFAQSVKQQTDIVRVVGDYIKLRKSGANWSALCPFHKEKSGSFYLYPASASYYCFGCHEHGDVFTFVMKMESLSFPEAVRAVAGKMGIAVPQRDFSPHEVREAGLRKQLLEVQEAATQYFQQNLRSPEAARAREYMTGRGISDETIKTFRIGYAPESFNDMRERLGKFFPEEVLRGSGLFSSKESDDGSAGPMYARFRRRVMFPICNEAGKPIAFTARALLTTDEDPKAGAKYINSPETGLYTKGQVLFNLDKAKSAVRETDSAILVEGQMDCISVYMAGIGNVVATSGTAFTEHQARLLGRFTKRVVLNFDGDTAGINAAEKVLGMLVEEGFEVRLAMLEGGFDPDSFIRRHGVQDYAALLRSAVPYMDFLVDRARTQFGTRTPEGRVKALNYLLPHIRRIPSHILRTQVARDAAQKLGIESSEVMQELNTAASRRLDSVRAPQPRAVSEVERILLCALVLPEADSVRQLAAGELSTHPEWYEELPSAAVIDALVHAPVPDNPLAAAPDEASRALLASALHQAVPDESEDAHEKLHEQVRGALRTQHERKLERRLRELRGMIGEAERRGDSSTMMQLAHEKLQVERELRAL